jgi:hypothetical protein
LFGLRLDGGSKQQKNNCGSHFAAQYNIRSWRRSAPKQVVGYPSDKGGHDRSDEPCLRARNAAACILGQASETGFK